MSICIINRSTYCNFVKTLVMNKISKFNSSECLKEYECKVEAPRPPGDNDMFARSRD